MQRETFLPAVFFSFVVTSHRIHLVSIDSIGCAYARWIWRGGIVFVRRVHVHSAQDPWSVELKADWGNLNNLLNRIDQNQSLFDCYPVIQYMTVRIWLDWIVYRMMNRPKICTSSFSRIDGYGTVRFKLSLPCSKWITFFVSQLQVQSTCFCAD